MNTDIIETLGRNDFQGKLDRTLRHYNGLEKKNPSIIENHGAHWSLPASEELNKFSLLLKGSES